MSALTVGVDGPALERTVSALIATLPLSFTLARGARPDVVAVDGRPGTWGARARESLEVARHAVVVVEPGLPTTHKFDQLIDASRTSGTKLVLSESYRNNPALQEVGLSGLVPSHTTGTYVAMNESGPLVDSLLRQLRVLQAVGATSLSLELVTATERAIVACVAMELAGSGTLVDLVSVRSQAAPTGHSLRLTAWHRTLELDLPSPNAARPAHIRVVDPTGAKTFPTIFETGHRATWRRVHQILEDDSAFHAIDEFRDAVDAVQAVHTPAAGRAR